MIKLLQQPNPAEAPKKRFRGQRGYYRRVLRRARKFRLNVSEDNWWDFWHYHADWPGYGNLGWRHRRMHIEALSVVFLTCAEQLRGYPQDYQLWILLCADDAGQDAVYLHTRNPNHDNFPRRWEDVQWGQSDTEEFFTSRLAPYRPRAGLLRWEGKQYLLVYCPGVGIPLE